MTYAALTAELDTLLRELEAADVPLDALTQKVQRCYALIREGRAHLRTAEEAVAQVLDVGLEDETGFTDPSDTVA